MADTSTADCVEADATTGRCDLCGSRESRVVGRFARDFRPLVNVVCCRCGLTRQDPLPTEAELREYYARKYRLSYKGSAEPRQRDLDRHRSHAEARLRLLDPLLKPGTRILDIGSGSGTFLLLAKQRGHAVQGIEPDARYAERVQREHDVPVHAGSWETAEFAPGAFDVVTMHHVLEHLRLPIAALRRIHQWTAPGGYLYVGVPNIKTAEASPLNRYHRAHLHGFSPETLVMAALKAGFSPHPLLGTKETHLVFRRLDAPLQDWFIYPGHGEQMIAFFEQNTLLRYLLRPNAYRRLLRHAKRGLFER